MTNFNFKNRLLKAMKEILIVEDFDENFLDKLKKIQINFLKKNEQPPLKDIISLFVEANVYEREALKAYLANDFISARENYKLASECYNDSAIIAKNHGQIAVFMICKVCSLLNTANTFKRVNITYIERAVNVLVNGLITGEKDVGDYQKETLTDDEKEWLKTLSEGFLFHTKAILNFRLAKREVKPNTQNQLFSKAIANLTKAHDCFNRKPFTNTLKAPLIAAELKKYQAEELQQEAVFLANTSQFAQAAEKFKASCDYLEECLEIQVQIKDNIRGKRTEYDILRYRGLAHFYQAKDLSARIINNEQTHIEDIRTKKEEEKIETANRKLFSKLKTLLNNSKKDFLTAIEKTTNQELIAEIEGFVSKCNAELEIIQCFLPDKMEINGPVLALNYLVSSIFKIIPEDYSEAIKLSNYSLQAISEVIVPQINNLSFDIISVKEKKKILRELEIRELLINSLLNLCEGEVASKEKKVIQYEFSLIFIERLLACFKENKQTSFKISDTDSEFTISEGFIKSLKGYVSARIFIENAKKFHPSHRWLYLTSAIKFLVYPIQEFAPIFKLDKFKTLNQKTQTNVQNLEQFTTEIMQLNSNVDIEERAGVAPEFWETKISVIDPLVTDSARIFLQADINPLVCFLKWLFLKSLCYSITIRAWDALYSSIRNIQLDKKIVFTEIAHKLFKLAMEISPNQKEFCLNQARGILCNGLSELFYASKVNELTHKKEYYTQALKKLQKASSLFSALFNERLILSEVYLKECQSMILFIEGLEEKEQKTKVEKYQLAKKSMIEALQLVQNADEMLRRPIYWYKGLIYFLEAIFFTSTISNSTSDKEINDHLAVLTNKILLNLDKAIEIFKIIETLSDELLVEKEGIFPIAQMVEYPAEKKYMCNLITSLKKYFEHYTFQFRSYREKDFNQLLLLENKSVKLQQEALSFLEQIKLDILPFLKSSLKKWIKVGVSYHKIFYLIYYWFLTTDESFKISLATYMKQELAKLEDRIDELEQEALFTITEEYIDFFEVLEKIGEIIDIISPSVDNIKSEKELAYLKELLLAMPKLLNEIDNNYQRKKLLWIISNLEQKLPEKDKPRINQILLINIETGELFYSYKFTEKIAVLSAGLLSSLNSFGQEVLSTTSFKTMDYHNLKILRATKEKLALYLIVDKFSIELGQLLEETVDEVYDKVIIQEKFDFKEIDRQEEIQKKVQKILMECFRGYI
ncbi:MAG: hypothetical protein GF308_11290 [Candidatus Heimdallarchaeota archaeon]|nr:hypothetical protein [Candidatus Heimdallarchaeota archaeon]